MNTSITAKFGLDTTPFNRGLVDVRNRLKATDIQMQNLNRTVGKFTQLMGMVGAAALAIRVLGGFFKAAFDRAEELEGSVNRNAEAVRKFKETSRDAWNDLKTGAGTASLTVLGILARIGEAFGTVLRLQENLVQHGMSYSASLRDIEKANKNGAEEARMAKLKEEADMRNLENRKELGRATERQQRQTESAQKEMNRLIEQEAKLRDDAFLKSLSPEDLVTELKKRIEDMARTDAAPDILASGQRMRDLSKAPDGEGETQKAERLNALEQERTRYAQLQVQIASRDLSLAELEVMLAETQAQIEEQISTEKGKQNQKDQLAKDLLQDKIKQLREEQRIARENLQQAQQSLEGAKFNRVAPTIAEAAEEGQGRVRRLARSALSDEERARQAFLRGNTGKGRELEARARETRDDLKGIIQSSDSNPLKAQFELVKKSEEHLAQIAKDIAATAKALTMTEVSE